ncbi:MAG: methyltransferase domain-containing protein [Gammaproteobacteria bacterium]
MEKSLHHDMDLPKSRDDLARARFVSGLRAYVLTDVATQMRTDYEQNIEPELTKDDATTPKDGWAVHRAIRDSDTFKRYSSLRCATQELVWDTVMDNIEQHGDTLDAKFEQMTSDQSRAQGTLSLDPELDIPAYVNAVDVHLMPGNYGGSDDSLSAGAVYDQGLNVFAFGMMGRRLNDIGWSMAKYYQARNPNDKPQVIVDVGCSIGHNTLPWKQTYPDAEVHGVDVAASCVRYAHARAQAMGVTVHFHQAKAEMLNFDDNSADIVFSSMFLHELPKDAIDAYMREARRILKPGGVMLNMELPPNENLGPYDAFYLDWDCYYNNEPFYKGFRDQSYRALCLDAGFDADTFFEAVMPRYTYIDEETFVQAVSGPVEFDENTGRLADSIQWYGFGARKAKG